MEAKHKEIPVDITLCTLHLNPTVTDLTFSVLS